jgi:hypothetical protein
MSEDKRGGRGFRVGTYLVSEYEHQVLPAKGPRGSRPAGLFPGYHRDGDYRLFRAECTQTSQRSDQPVMFTLASEAVDGGDPWVLEYEEGTPVVRLLGVCQAAS